MLVGRSVSMVSWACVCRLSTYGTHAICPARRKQVVAAATEYPAVVRMLERQLPLVGGRNENVTVTLCASRTLRNRLPALSRSDVVRDRSNVVKTAPTQVTEADGVNVLSIVLFTATLPRPPAPAPAPAPAPTPNVGCSLIDSARRYP